MFFPTPPIPTIGKTRTLVTVASLVSMVAQIWLLADEQTAFHSKDLNIICRTIRKFRAPKIYFKSTKTLMKMQPSLKDR